ncbi:MAG: hypothetical protein H0U76_04195 [Ktedonobacteraceae bacterium]|nr:hypothetical protein [Ktedonobacteraceae bacterium]
MAWLLADGTAILAQFSGKDIALSYEMLQPLEPASQLAYVRSHLHAHGFLAGEDDMGPIQGFLQVQKASIQALDTYTPRVYLPGAPGEMVALFYTEEMLQAGVGEEQHRQFSDESLGWNSLIPQGIHIYKVPGNHISMLTPPHIRVVAERLRHCLDRAQEYRHQ